MADTVLMLRTCNADMLSHEGFVWPESGPVDAPDWRDDDECGHGLHGLLWGEGDSRHLSRSNDAKWLVVEVERSDIRNLFGKYKFPRGNVILCGSREVAVKCIQLAAPEAAVHFGIAAAGDWGTAIAGYRGTTIAGNHGIATAGRDGTATAGNGGTATAGKWGTANAGDWGTANVGSWGTASTGRYGTATAGRGGTALTGDDGIATSTGDDGIATAGDGGIATTDDYGTATAGRDGTATAGYHGTAIAGYGGTVTAGKGGVLIIEFQPAGGGRERRVAMVGQGGILPNTAYRCVQGEWEVVEG